MSFIDTERMARAAANMQEAAERNERAADRIEAAVQRLATLVEDGYGNNVTRLIQLLEKEPT